MPQETMSLPLVKTAGEVLDRASLDPARIGRSSDRFWSLFTGFYALDDCLNGLEPGQLYVLAGAPSAGKSSFARCVAERVAINQRQPVLFFTLEMPADTFLTQMACSRARVDPQQWRAGTVNVAERLLMVQVTDRLQRSPLWIDDTADLAIAHIRDRARQARLKRGLELVVVDGLLLVQSGIADRVQEVAFVASQLKAMALQLSIPVLATVTHAGAPEPATIEETADAVMSLSRDPVSGAARLAVTKNRTGPTGGCELAFIRRYARFENLADPSPRS